MRKEVIIAVIAGLTIGLTMAFGVYRVNSKNAQNTGLPQSPVNQISEKNESQDSEEIKLSLTNLQDGTIYAESPILISGISSKQSSVAISTQSEDFVVMTGDQGEFEQSVKLTKGVNTIMVTSFDSNGLVLGSITSTVVFYPDFSKDISAN